ncbi:RHS repeat domain-containing protein [Lutibacter sp.]
MKNTLIFIFLLCISTTGFSQEDYYGKKFNSNIYTASQIIGNPNVKPPDVAAFQKVNFVPVTNYTGRTNISIPIYEISAGSMSVPISLSYNSSGVKVNEAASNVGLSWSLNAGGMISKIVKGIDDFQRPDKANDPVPYMTPSGWLGYTNANFTIHELNRYNDAQPDLFSVNAPGFSTQYIHKKQYSTNTNGTVSLISTILPEAIELEHKGTIINENLSSLMSFYGFDSIQITPINGIVYNFVSRDISTYHSGYSTPISSFGNLNKTESYRLNSMFDPSSNQTITFEYEEYAINFYDAIPLGVNSYGGGTDLELLKNSNSYTVYPTTQRLTKITFDKGEVQFIYGLNRLDNTDEKALTEVKIIDTNGNTIKHFKLDYGYFQSAIESDMPQSKRLRLDKIYQVDNSLNELPGHTFTYDTSFEMPPRTSYAHDFLGYNNGTYSSANTNPIPKLYFYNNRIYPFYTSGSIELTGNYSLAANADYVKTYSLTKITFPTGGTNEYEYELNEFYDRATQSGGGLRIKTQKLDDGKGNLQILDYQYSGGHIAKLPTYAVFRLNQETLGIPTTLSELTNYLGMDTFMMPQSQVELTNGAFVGYSGVTVKNRIDNGRSEYYYSNTNTYPNLYSTKTFDSSLQKNVSWDKIAPQSLFVDQDYLRGKIKSEIIYNKLGEPRLEKNYFYTQKEFSTISLDYINKVSYKFNVNCYDSNYYFSTCGFFKEEITIPIARDVLTTVITKDYQADKIVPTQGGNENVPFTFQTELNYFYDTQYPLVLKEMKRVSTCDETQGETQDCVLVSDQYDDRVFKVTAYPLTGEEEGTQNGDIVSNLPYANELVTQNRLSIPLKVEFKNKDSEIIAKEEHYYTDFGSVIGLEKINFISRDESIIESETITKRDIKGRITEYKKKNGIFVSRIYGYNSNYLIADVVNSSESNTLLKLGSLQTPFNQGTTANDTDIRALMSELRDEMPEAQITSYTYDSLIGVTSITDPRGETIYYEYDEFNRLKQVKDSEGNILSKNEYHYKNQQ